MRAEARYTQSNGPYQCDLLAKRKLIDTFEMKPNRFLVSFMFKK